MVEAFARLIDDQGSILKMGALRKKLVFFTMIYNISKRDGYSIIIRLIS